MNKHTSCLICGSEKLIKLPKFYEKHGLVKCRNCNFVFMEQIPTDEELGNHYFKYSYDITGYLSPFTINSYNLLLDEFEKYRVSNRLLDVGCGRGWFLEEAKKRGWEVFGTEYSDAALKICREKDINMKSGKLNPDDFIEKDFDVITSFEVIEHINNPNEEMSNITTLLRNGGLFYCTTPNFNSFLRYYLKENYTSIIEYPEHLSYYTRKTLTSLATKHHFRPVKFLSTGISLSAIKTSRGISNESLVSQDTADEKLRKRINDKWIWRFAKRVVNFLLTVFGLGVTLKGYYVKR